MKKAKHILVIRLSAMGDVAMLAPVIRCVLDQNDAVKITVLSRKFLKPIFDEEILGKKVSFFEADTKKKHKGFFGLFKLAKELKRLNITTVADTHNVLRSKILRFFLFLFGINNASIDKGRAEKKDLINHKNFKQLKATHERYADVFRKLGFQIDFNKHQFLKNIKFEFENKFKNFLLENKGIIGIAPFAQYQGKMYPLDLMEKVIEELSKDKQIFLFGGGKKETDLLTKIANKYKNVQNIAGKISLKEELQLIANIDVMLSMDSGNAHFSAMLGIKTVTIWGVTHPFAGFVPFQQQDNCLLPDLEKYPKIPCSIYGNKVCEGYEDVMRTIEPMNIVLKIERILDN